MSGDLQAKRKNKNRSKKKNQLHELERKEHFEESLNKFSTEDIGVENVSTKNKVSFSSRLRMRFYVAIDHERFHLRFD